MYSVECIGIILHNVCVEVHVYVSVHPYIHLYIYIYSLVNEVRFLFLPGVSTNDIGFGEGGIVFHVLALGFVQNAQV